MTSNLLPNLKAPLLTTFLTLRYFHHFPTQKTQTFVYNLSPNTELLTADLPPGSGFGVAQGYAARRRQTRRLLRPLPARAAAAPVSPAARDGQTLSPGCPPPPPPRAGGTGSHPRPPRPSRHHFPRAGCGPPPGPRRQAPHPAGAPAPPAPPPPDPSPPLPGTYCLKSDTGTVFSAASP